MPEGDLAVLDERNGHRRPHAGGARVAVRAVVHTPIGLLDQGDDPLLSPFVRTALLERRGREPRRHLAGLRAAHPVGDREERGLDDVGVLVATALAAGIGDRADVTQEAHSYLRSVSPTRTMSPC